MSGFPKKPQWLTQFSVQEQDFLKPFPKKIHAAKSAF
jgi:hypothetical protein